MFRVNPLLLLVLLFPVLEVPALTSHYSRIYDDDVDTMQQPTSYRCEPPVRARVYSKPDDWAYSIESYAIIAAQSSLE